MIPQSDHPVSSWRRVVGAALLLAAVTGALVALSSGAPGGGIRRAGASAEGATARAATDAGVGLPWEDAAPYPVVFDPRRGGLLTRVRSQERHSTCWAMAATGALESSILRREGGALDLSVNNLANHTGSRLRYEGMAPGELALAYYARWDGPVRESSDPYPRPGESPPYLRAVRHVQEALILPERRGPLDNAAVKWSVMTYGAAAAAVDFRVQERYRSWNEPTHAYYNAERRTPNHHVMIVGWDDDFPAARFLSGSRPPGDGAFLIQNSWGEDWAGDGFAWVSYHDATIGDAAMVFSGVEAADNYDAIYQYDPLGRSAWIGAGGGETAWFANRFIAARTGAVKAVSFYTPVSGTGYEVRVAGSVAGVAAAPVAATGAIAVPGYHTVRLPQPVSVTAGSAFVVAVRVDTPGWPRPVPVEAPSDLIAPRACPGESFVSADGSEWRDLTTLDMLPGLARANVNLKALADSAGPVESRPSSIRLWDAAARPGSKASVRWRLDGPPLPGASAIVAMTVRDAAGEVVARHRIAAVAAGGHGVWTPRASWPPGRYGVTARAYDVAGGGQTSSGRATLVVRGAPRSAAGGRLRR